MTRDPCHLHVLYPSLHSSRAHIILEQPGDRAHSAELFAMIDEDAYLQLDRLWNERGYGARQGKIAAGIDGIRSRLARINELVGSLDTDSDGLNENKASPAVESKPTDVRFGPGGEIKGVRREQL